MHIFYANFNCINTFNIIDCMSFYSKSIFHFTSLSLIHNAWTRILKMNKTIKCDYLNLFYYQNKINEQIKPFDNDFRLTNYICYYCHYRVEFRIWFTWRWNRWNVNFILSSKLLSILLNVATAIFQFVTYECCHENVTMKSIEHWIIYLKNETS